MGVKDQKEEELYEINFESFFRGIKNYTYKKKFLSIIFVFISLTIFSIINRSKLPIYLGDSSIALSDTDSSNISNFYKSSLERQILILTSEKSLLPLVDYYNRNPLKKKYFDEDLSYSGFSKLVSIKPDKSNTRFLSVEFTGPNKALIKEMLDKIYERFDQIISLLHQEDLQKIEKKYKKLLTNKEISIDESITKIDQFLLKRDISLDEIDAINSVEEIIMGPNSSEIKITDRSNIYKSLQNEMNIINNKKLNLVDILDFSKLRNDYLTNLSEYNTLRGEYDDFKKRSITINSLQIFKNPTIYDFPINKSNKDYFFVIFSSYFLSLLPYQKLLKIAKTN